MSNIYWRNKKAYRLCLLRCNGGIVKLEKQVAVEQQDAALLLPASVGMPGSADASVCAGYVTAAAPQITLRLVERRKPSKGEPAEDSASRKRKLPAACWVLAREARGGLRFKPLLGRKHS